VLSDLVAAPIPAKPQAPRGAFRITIAVSKTISGFPGNGLSLCAFRSRLQFCDYLVDRIFGLVDLALIE
jgi:hypothetical protein